jgi:arginyl-tRNA synthetase
VNSVTTLKAYETASFYHEFYEACRIINRVEGQEPKVDMARLLMAEATGKVLETCFNIIGLRFVDKM